MTEAEFVSKTIRCKRSIRCETCALLKLYAAENANLLPTFRGNLSVGCDAIKGIINYKPSVLGSSSNVNRSVIEELIEGVICNYNCLHHLPRRMKIYYSILEHVG